jgi:hypothetical protein
MAGRPTMSHFIVNICSAIFEHSTPLSYSSFTYYILAVNGGAKFTIDFRSTHVFNVKKTDESAKFAAGGSIKRSTHHNSLCGDKNKH